MIYKPRHFDLKELLCPHLYTRFGDFAWRFFDERLLMTIDFLRDHLGTLYANNYDLSEAQRSDLGLGLYDERGLRCTECDEVKKAIKAGRPYASAHLRAMATDFNSMTMSAEQIRLWILSNYSILPFAIRVEKGTPTWVHIDVCNGGSSKVELINP